MNNNLAYFGQSDVALQYLKQYESIIGNKISVSLIKSELALLEISESVLTKSQQFDLHLDLILNQGSKALTNYYKNLSKGTNSILESAKLNLSTSQIQKIDEAIKKFNSANRLNEQLSQPVANDPLTSLSQSLKNTLTKASSLNQSNVQAPASTGSTSTTDLLSELWNALTEDQSPIGILHLVLDIVGLLGDGVFLVTGIPIGQIADLLNAIIYLWRGKWMLCTISIISALLPFGGDALKGLKGSAEAAEKVMMKTATAGGKEGAEELAKLPVKEHGPVIKLLRFISKNISSVLSKGMNILSKFFSVFLTKVVGWIPFVGGKLKTFFESIGKVFSNYSQKMTKFADEFATVEKDALSVAAKNADSAVSKMFKENGSMVIDHSTNTIQCLDSTGKAIGAPFSSELLSNAKVINSKYPSLFRVGDPDTVVKYYNALNKSNKELEKTISSELVKRGLIKIGMASKLSLFIGKQIIKLITHADPEKNGYSTEEIQYWGNSALENWIAQRAREERERTGATYIPAVNLDSSDKEVFDRLTKYQNNYAKLFGMPSIIPVVYDKFGNEEVKDEFDNFFKAVAEGKIKHNADGSVEKVESDKDDKSSETHESFKYILPYSAFIKNY
jgi:hypothetical protein